MPQSAAAFLAIDLGADSGRAIVAALSGDSVTTCEVHRFPNRPLQLPTGLHWDVPALLNGVLEGITRAIEWTHAKPCPLHSLGVDTWGVDFALLGASGELLALPHCYRDPRNPPAFERVLKQIGRDVLYARTGIQLMPFNTLYQLIAWRDAEPDLLRAARSLLFMPDLMHYLLSGRAVVEETIASTSQMIDACTGRWATDLLETLQLPTHFLQSPVPAGSSLGPLRAELRPAHAGAAPLNVVAPACHDTASAVAAVPADPAARWCFLSSGTWSVLGAELDRPCLSSAARDLFFANERGLGGTIRFLKNTTGLWLLQECRREFAARGTDLAHEDLMRAADQAAPFRTIVDPDDPAFLSPGNMPGKLADRARRTGQPVPQSIPQFVRCCLESLALSYRRTLNQLEQVLGRTFDVIHVVGGGSQNRMLNQMTSDATGRRVVAGPHEATAIGNALTQAMAAGHIRDRFEIRRIIARSFKLESFEPRATRPWDEAWDCFAHIA